MKWFLKYRPDLARLITRCTRSDEQMSSPLALCDSSGKPVSRGNWRTIVFRGICRGRLPLLDVWRKFQLARPDLVSH